MSFNSDKYLIWDNRLIGFRCFMRRERVVIQINVEWMEKKWININPKYVFGSVDSWKKNLE